MNLGECTADLRLQILADLKAGKSPRQGEYSESVLREARSKGQPQMGSTHFEPTSIVLEFIFPDPHSSSVVLAIRVQAPERIVFLPVPSWVVESIWEGQIDGSFQFESDAYRMLEDLAKVLTPENNPAMFGPKAPTKRS